MSHCVKTTSVFAVVVAHSCICPQQNFFLSPLSASPHSQNDQKVLPFNRAVGRFDNLREEIKYFMSPLSAKICGWVWGRGEQFASLAPTSLGLPEPQSFSGGFLGYFYGSQKPTKLCITRGKCPFKVDSVQIQIFRFMEFKFVLCKT